VPEGIASRIRAVAAALVATAAFVSAAGCAGPGGEAKPPPVGLSPGMAGLRVRVRRDPAPLDQEVGAALEAELARAGIAVAIDDRVPTDADVKLSLDLHSVGPVVEGVATASVERGGTLIERASTPLDVYRRDRFPSLVARQLAEALAKSSRVAALAGGPTQPTAPAPEASAPAGVAPPPTAPSAPAVATPAPPPSAAPPAAAAPPPAAPQPLPIVAPPLPPGPQPLGRSGRFGWGVGLELQIGAAQIVAPGTSPVGFHLALGVQADMGPRAAFRLPLVIVGASGGATEFAEGSFVPTYIYRFRNDADQMIVPYVGLGLKLAFIVGGRQLLGRPNDMVITSDSCRGRFSTDAVKDCGFAVSPEPTAGFEWHANRLFALDIAAAYSFAHLTSSAGLVSWIHVISIYVGPRLSF
jgi:hypothetical protein